MLRWYLILCLTYALGRFVVAAPHGRSANDETNGLLQDLVTWDEHSLIVHGERVMFFSGEFHPFRLPVPGLWLDVFQKIKSMGFNGVSFYTDWGLLEGNPGHVVAEGVFGLDVFFTAAAEAGIYLLARPGPYINAETAAGGFPGWTLRINGTLRSTAPDYLEATRLYIATVGKIIAGAQITNGGPVVLVQPENEYSSFPGVNASQFPDQMNREYMAFVESGFRDAGIVVPFIDNDNLVLGSFAPGTGLGAVDIYGIDAYPMRYDCANPSIWPTYRFPRNWQITHEQQSPSTPFAIPEFQGGSGTSWGGVSQDGCNALVNEEAVRVVYKNNYSFGVKLMNIYMTYGGTNWGNLGYMGGDTSYDYGAAITEDRHVWREKYSEEKLEANFFKVSPAYLTASPGNASNGSYVSTDSIAVTPLFGNGDLTNFYVVRHADFTSLNDTDYTLTVSTSTGTLTLPQLGGQLVLRGRDSKIHLTDYDLGGITMVYSTAEVFSWAKSTSGKRVLILYGGMGETHEFALPSSLEPPIVLEGECKDIRKQKSLWVVQWQVTKRRQVVRFGRGELEVHLLWRNDAYNHWSLELPAQAPIFNYTSTSKYSVIIKAGYLLRTARISGNSLHLTGDLNATTQVEVIFEPTERVSSMTFNGVSVKTTRSPIGKLTADMPFDPPSLHLPDLAAQQWKLLDSLPEVHASYDDSLWKACNSHSSTNPLKLETPTSLYASDYGYHTGSLIYRGHFTANGQEHTLFVNTTGGAAFGHSVWLNGSFLGSWKGDNANQTYAQNISVPTLQSGTPQVITILIDHMGQDEEAPGTDAVKFPRGILDFQLSGHVQTDVIWKMTGNLGGEQYRDMARGPRNEGALFAERQGYHLPDPPSVDWAVANPIDDGVPTAGVRLFTTAFDLHVSIGYDVPMSFVFTNNTMGGSNTTGEHYRVQLFVNGFQFGKYISHLGPQTAFPVPEGILNYNGTNYLAITLWALDPQGARLGGLELVPQMPVWSGYRKPALSPQPKWELRSGVY